MRQKQRARYAAGHAGTGRQAAHRRTSTDMEMRGVGVTNRFIVIEPWSVILYVGSKLGMCSGCAVGLVSRRVWLVSCGFGRFGFHI